MKNCKEGSFHNRTSLYFIFGARQSDGGCLFYL
nr:MAG TPA: hypothetical protein [Caudoviricetes sp.]